MKRAFFFYKSYVTDVEGCFTEAQYREYIDAIILYGVTGECEIKDHNILPAFIQRRESIDASLMRYKRAVINGKKGGRKKSITKGEIIEAIKLGVAYEGDAKDLAQFFGCSERTILRRFNRKELEKLIKMAEIRRIVGRYRRLPRGFVTKYDFFLMACDIAEIESDYKRYFKYLPRLSGHKWEYGYRPNDM